MKKVLNLKGLIFLIILALLLLTFAVLVATAAQGDTIEREPVIVIETPRPTAPPSHRNLRQHKNLGRAKRPRPLPRCYGVKREEFALTWKKQPAFGAC